MVFEDNSASERNSPPNRTCIAMGKFVFALLTLLFSQSVHPFQPHSTIGHASKSPKSPNHLAAQPILKNTDIFLTFRRFGCINTSLKLIPSSVATPSGDVVMCCLQNAQIPRLLTQTPTIITMYILLANTIYILRRSHIRSLAKRKLLDIRITREDGVTTTLYLTNLLVWQLFVTVLFPFTETLSRIFGYVSFYYFYPNASGLGIIFEPLAVQHLTMNKRAKHQIRFDWHRFSMNTGNVGRDGYRHPPSIERNLPHMDVPNWGWKHWPWRRRHQVCDVKQAEKRSGGQGRKS